MVFKGNFEYNDIVKPELCGQLVSTERYRNQWSTSENIAKKKSLRQQREKKIFKFIEKFIDDFNVINGRDPIESEIVDNLKDQLDIEIIKEISGKIYSEKEKEKDKVITSAIEPDKLTNRSIEISNLPV